MLKTQLKAQGSQHSKHLYTPLALTDEDHRIQTSERRLPMYCNSPVEGSMSLVLSLWSGLVRRSANDLIAPGVPRQTPVLSMATTKSYQGAGGDLVMGQYP